MKYFILWTKRIVVYPLLITILIIAVTSIITNLITTPSNNRPWNTDQEILPYAEINGDMISMYNIRNFSYASTTSYTPAYYDKTFDLSKIKKAYYIVEPFAGFSGSAHTFLSFEFEEDQFIAISVEIRKEKGESFSAIKGLFNQYELMYVIADERDVVKLRSNYRNDLVYVYPLNTTKEKTVALFLDMIDRANTLKNTPEFYNSITNNCTTNIIKHANKITPRKIPAFDKNALLPAYTDELAYRLGLIDTDLSFEDARKRFLINDRALKYTNDPLFSIKIRQEE